MTHTIQPNAESLLSEIDWLRALAHQLVRTEDRAEDLYQETVLAALQDRNTARGPLRPWLRGVARHLVANRHRREQRAAARDAQAARPEAQPSAAATVERFAGHRKVVDALDELDERTKTVILLRYWDDLPPREIAARLSHCRAGRSGWSCPRRDACA